MRVGPGRPKKAIWRNNFTRIINENGQQSKCDICLQVWSGCDPKRLEGHRKHCKMESSESEDDSDDSMDERVKRIKIEAARLPTEPLEKKADKRNIDDLFGLFVYSCSDPMKVAGSPHLKALLEALRPGYSVPTIDEVKSTIGPRCKEKLISMLPIATNLFSDQELQSSSLSHVFEGEAKRSHEALAED